MSVSTEEWKRAYPEPASVTLRGALVLYGGRLEALLDDVLDRKIPEPWGSEMQFAVDPQTLAARRFERSVAFFEVAVQRLTEEVRKLGAGGGAGSSAGAARGRR